MSFLYILIRTYPFWALPLGVTLFLVCISKHSKKIPKKTKSAYMVTSILLAITSGLFLFLGGPTKVIPILHALMQGQDPGVR